MEDNKSTSNEAILMVVLGIAVLVFVVIMIFTNQGAPTQPASIVEDSVAIASEKANKDSVNAFYLKEQDKVIGDITFGINEKQFNRLSEKFEKSTAIKGDFGITENTIGNYRFSGMHGEYYKGKLHEVDVRGYPISYEHYESELKEQIGELYKIISKKYGEHTYGTGPVAMYQTERNRSYLAYGWSISTKAIQIRIEDHGEYYYVNMDIFQPHIRLIINKQYEDKKESATKKAVESI